MVECQITRLGDKCDTSKLRVFHSFHDSPFGRCLLAFVETEDGEEAICHLAFADDGEAKAESCLRARFPGAQFLQEDVKTEALLGEIFHGSRPKRGPKVRVLLKGTSFQMDVWESLTAIPAGTLSTYQQVAQQLGNPKAARAVGGALRANQVGYLIPCHRVVCKSGCNKFSWGVQRKLQMQDYERSHVTEKINK